MSIGENIRTKREAIGLSQKALAEAIGSGENTVAGWEKDKNAPPGDKVVSMSKLFGCATDEILLENSERDVTPEMKALFRRFSDLPDSMKPLARSMMSALLASIEDEASRKHVA
ncbi:helix-turn-helix transcriptional regulator [Pseudomonas yamanorum]|nr:helix-turn-helix transcriptional regulator [Pseudomonas yamanorum]QLG96425.1 helix-turn-helix transcriptional regulator [Pseudomonas yamanorum]QLG96427.1 helix-turn-helix transcriptional regulator [Pseudomonas yamanorum]QLG96429.1 helix-turn-helix transcriptional regulator [Pseudomonas yamanorum]QLG96430.1 helix-turn-helix transcriptional regulator [Pseudomonas yamanorum]